MSPVHQVLGTAELLDIILICLRDQIHEDTKADLSTLHELVEVVSSRPWPISMLRVLEQADLQLLSALSKLGPLRHVHLRILEEDVSGIGPELWAHQQVVIQEPKLGFGRDLGPYLDARKQCIQRIFPPQGHLRQLQIHGRNGLISRLADSQQSPPSASFQCVDLRVPCGFVDQQDLLTPATMAKILRANPNVVRLTIEGPNPQAREHGSAFRQVQPDSAFHTTQPFLTALASCSKLTHLSVTQVMFSGGDTLLNILRVVTSLPELRFALIHPLPISTDEGNHMRPAPYTVLEVIARTNVHLRHLSTMVDLHSVQDIPDLPPDRVYDNSMRVLLLIPCVVRGFPNPSISNQLKVAQYLDRIFPSTDVSPGLTGFWEPIVQIIRALRGVRSSTVHHRAVEARQKCRRDVGTQTYVSITT